MKRLTIAIPDSQEWLLDALESLKGHGACPGASVSQLVREILARELKHLRKPSRLALAMADNGYDGPNDLW